MLLHDLTIQNYRSFNKYHLDGLARVNLLVGDNNSGKTSVLEAVRFLAKHGAVSEIWDSLRNRGEINLVASPNGKNLIQSVRISELFSDSGSESNSLHRISFRSSQFGECRISLGPSKTMLTTVKNDIHDFGGDFAFLMPHVASIGAEPGLWLFTRFVSSSGSCYRYLEATSDGALLGQAREGGSPYVQNFSKSPGLYMPTVAFVSPLTQDTDMLKISWANLVKRRRREFVTTIMRAVIPEVTSIEILPTPHAHAKSRADVIIQTIGDSVSLSRFGDGSHWLLNIAINLASSENGMVLIDEIDTGLHYSRLADMWRMVIQTAIELDVQVFATTHSLDCIRGLAEAVRGDELFGEEVAIFKIDRRTDHAARYAGDELEIIVDQEIEVR